MFKKTNTQANWVSLFTQPGPWAQGQYHHHKTKNSNNNNACTRALAQYLSSSAGGVIALVYISVRCMFGFNNKLQMVMVQFSFVTSQTAALHPFHTIRGPIVTSTLKSEWWSAVNRNRPACCCAQWKQRGKRGINIRMSSSGDIS